MHDYLLGLIGGMMIGSAAALYLLGNGRIMGASGIIGGLLDGSAGAAWRERAVFLAGLIGAPLVVVVLSGATPDTALTSNPAILVAAGLLVGLGTRLANGCTSGHGVCGISRLSPRGIAATLVYLLAGGVTVVMFKHLWGLI